MTIADIYEAVYFCTADTLMASAFRKAVGLTQHHRAGSITVRVDRFKGTRKLMNQRYGVRM